MRFKIFISSVQSEFAEERKRLVEFLSADALLGKFFDVFAFENMPAVNHNPQKVYIDEVKRHCSPWHVGYTKEMQRRRVERTGICGRRNFYRHFMEKDRWYDNNRSTKKNNEIEHNICAIESNAEVLSLNPRTARKSSWIFVE